MEELALQPSVKLAFAIACKIALGSQSKSIEPVHLFLAVLQILDEAYELDAKEMGFSEKHLSSIKQEILSCRSFLGMQPSEITSLRRQIRRSLPFSPFLPEASMSLPRSEKVEQLLRELIHQASENQEPLSLNATLSPLFSMYQNGDFTHRLTRYWEDKSEEVGEVDINIETREETTTQPPLSALETIGTDLTELARQGKLSPVIGRDEEMLTIARILLRTTKRNVILIGEAGVGKTAIVEGLAQKFVDPRAPEQFQNFRIIQINVADLIAGTSYRGEMEERLQQVIKEVLSHENIILFIDEIHLVIKAGTVHDSSLDIANILKPALARNDFRCIGATTADEYERYIKPDAAFMRRFQTVHIQEPDKEVAFQICKKWAEKISQKLDVFFEDDAIRQAIELSITYLPSRRLPDKAIDLLDNAATYAAIQDLTFEDRGNDFTVKKIKADQIKQVLEDHYGVSIASRSFIDPLKTKEHLKKNVIGQSKAIEQIYQTCLKLALQDSKEKPILGAMLFIGPSGMGKSYAAECIVQSLNSGLGCPHLKIYLGQYKERHDLTRLTGAAPGLVGYDQQSPLFRFVNTYPEGVIILEDIEKAHLEVQEFVAQILMNGYANDNQGRMASFKRCLFILTSNITPVEDFTEELQLPENLHKELVNIVDTVVQFDSLSAMDYRKLFNRQWFSLVQQIESTYQVDLLFDQQTQWEFSIYLANRATDIRSFQKLFETYLTNKLLDHLQKLSPHGKIRIDWDGRELVFS